MPEYCSEGHLLPECEACGAPAEVILEDGSTWCLLCDTFARLDGLDNFPGELIEATDG